MFARSLQLYFAHRVRNIYKVFYLTGLHATETIHSGLHPSNTLVNLWHLGMFYGVAGTGVESVGLIFPTRQATSKPSTFRRTFLLTSAGVITFYWLFGLTGSLVGTYSHKALGKEANEIVFLSYSMDHKFIFYLSVLYASVNRVSIVSVIIRPDDDLCGGH